MPEKNLPEKNLIVIGNGMVGHKFLERMVAKGATETWNLRNENKIKPITCRGLAFGQKPLL
ncbi:MAG: hypothetical protein LH647_03385 [Leptolyngbyaceae cyanobacterium CAN_BIN12]|nr:hypothetical protein [Leptolyngbyaceae cyanobacterium CAN_BIN12]